MQSVDTLPKQSLYHIEQEHLAILAAIEDNEGIITPELDEALQLSEVAIQQKGISYAWAIKKFLNESRIIKQEIDRLYSLKEKSDSIAETLTEKLSNGMQTFGIEKIETATLKLSFRKSEAVSIQDEQLIPNEFLIKRTVVDISKTKIKEAIKAGQIVPGAELVTRQNLQIK